MYNTNKVMMGFARFLIPNIYCKLVYRVCSPVSAENIVLHLPLRMGLKIVLLYPISTAHFRTVYEQMWEERGLLSFNFPLYYYIGICTTNVTMRYFKRRFFLFHWRVVSRHRAMNFHHSVYWTLLLHFCARFLFTYRGQRILSEM